MSGKGYERFRQLKIPHVNPWHTRVATGMGAICWFWIFYKLRNEGAVMFGFEDPPWVADAERELALEAQQRRLEMGEPAEPINLLELHKKRRD